MRNQRPKAPLFSGKELFHLVTLTVMLVALIVSLDRLRRPGSMNWFFGREVDATLAAPESTAPQAAPTKSSSMKPRAAPAYNPLRLVQTDECTEVDKELLAVVEDKTPVREEEKAAIDQLLCVAATTPPEELSKSSRRDVLFANLYNDPKQYRGQPIRVSGVLRRLIKWTELETRNAYGIPTIFEAWIFTENQPFDPMRILFTECPTGLAPGVDLKENVWIDAFFVKILAFQTAERKWKGAPELVGARLHWLRSEPAAISNGALVAAAAVVAVIAAGAFVFWRQSRRDDLLMADFHRSTGENHVLDIEFLKSTEDMAEHRATGPEGEKS